VIVVTGGAGFIGSVLVWQLNRRGRGDILVVDHLGSGEKWRNLVGLRYADYRDKEAFVQELESGYWDGAIDTIFHLGACSSTMERDADYLMRNNFRYSVRIAQWWERHPATRLVYASSAATYGAGEQGYRDDESQLRLLRPLNMYGYSKHLFDLYAQEHGWLSSIVGLKYFNVFGPNEYHKSEMRSMLCKAFAGVRDGGALSLFKSHRPEFGDGEQARDFVYVHDAVTMTLLLADQPGLGGIYNVGTGCARTWNDMGRALFAALGRPAEITYVPMPQAMRDKYQYHTQADLAKLRAAGCGHQCLSLESAVADYVKRYLLPGKLVAEAADK
jgi:ADP-L-glycero-D-manno-heptose 6-epimerase